MLHIHMHFYHLFYLATLNRRFTNFRDINFLTRFSLFLFRATNTLHHHWNHSSRKVNFRKLFSKIKIPRLLTLEKEKIKLQYFSVYNPIRIILYISQKRNYFYIELPEHPLIPQISKLSSTYI